jgi:hypothetical protein
MMASERVERAIILFRSKLVILQRSDRLFEQQWRPPGVCLAFGHSWCDKRVIVELPNLIHNVAPKRADIGRLTRHIIPLGAAR